MNVEICYHSREGVYHELVGRGQWVNDLRNYRDVLAALGKSPYVRKISHLQMGPHRGHKRTVQDIKRLLNDAS